MSTKIISNAIVLALFVSTLFPFLAIGSAFSRIEDGSGRPINARDQDDLSAMLRRAPFHEARVFEVARKHIQEMETSPACHQLATSTLINSCQSFSSLPGQDPVRITDNSLDEVRQEYAARLAVCELQGIKSGIPKECTPFVASCEACPRTSSRGFFRKNTSSQDEPKRACYPDFTPHQLKQCVDSLFDHGQRWTSYSNAQTNAIVICQASRGAVENEEHLHKLQDALRSQTSVSETLSRAVYETEDRLAQHHEFAKAVQRFQHDLTARNEAALAQADSMVARFVGKIDSTTEALLSILTKSFKTANDETNVLTSNIKAANDGVGRMRVALQELHDEAAIRERERAASQDLALKSHQALSAELQASLENVRDVTVLHLVERIRDFEETMVDYLGAQQQAFEDHFQEFTRTQGRVVQSLASQHEIIEEHNQKISEMDFSGLSNNNITTYLGLSIFIIILSKANLILGAAAATGLGIRSLLGPISFSNFPDLTLSTSLPAVPHALVWLSQVSAAVIIFLIIILVTFRLSVSIRNFMVSHRIFGSALEVEIKREPAAYYV